MAPSVSSTANGDFDDWDTCFVCPRNHRSSNATLRQNTTTIGIQEVIDRPALERYCTRNNVSTESVYQLALAIAVGAYAGVDAPCAGFASPTRPTPSIFRCKLNPNQQCRHLLQSLEVADLRLVECSSTSDKATATANAITVSLFDTALVLGHGDEIDLEPDGLRVLLKLYVQEPAPKVLLKLVENAIPISRATSLGSSFVQTVNSLVENDDLPVSELNIVGEADRARIKSWNSQPIQAEQGCIHDIIEERAREFPRSTAICAWDGTFTYDELDRYSSRLAQHLMERNVGPETVVPFLFHKSAWTVVAVLAILKAGAAPLGLNPEFPQDRLLYLVEFTNASLVLCGRDLAGIFTHTSVATLIVEAQSIEALPPSVAQASRSSTAENMGFVVFTSGSTGTPKGIVLEHGAYCTAVLAHHEALHIHRDSRVLHFASHSFDAILLEIMTTLMAGACICIPSEEQRMNNLQGAINDLSVSWVGITPTLAKLLSPADLPHLKSMALWGEAPNKDIIDIWADKVELFNVWGPAECSVISSVNKFSLSSNPLNIGGRTRASYLWLVRPDNYKELAPIGAIAEVIVQGRPVARGYLHDQERTATFFLDNLPWETSRLDLRSRRAYRTGDLVRYNEDGSLEFVGRRDTQVKLRGQRMELSEIEHHLNLESPSGAVTAVEVVTPVDRPKQQLLVAFLWPRHSSGIKPTDGVTQLLEMTESIGTELWELKHRIAKVLPPYMVPEAYLPLGQMPANASGKVDRKILRVLAANLPKQEMSTYIALSPQTSLDVIDAQNPLIKIVCEALSIDASVIRATDSFFSLGGDSILAMRVASAARAQGIHISTADVMSNPRISEIPALTSVAAKGAIRLSEAVDIFQADDILLEAASRKLKLLPYEIEDVVPATDYQTFNIATGLMETRGGTNYLTFDFTKPVALDKLRRACHELVERHAILRTVFVVHDRQLLQVALKRSPSIFRHVPQAGNLEAALETLIDQDKKSARTLNRPITEFTFLVKEDNTVQSFVLRISHGQYDGLSLVRILEDLRELFSGRTLPTIPHYHNYLRLVSRHKEEAERYWSRLLAGSKVSRIVEHSRPPFGNLVNAFANCSIPTSSILVANFTTATVLKTAWALVLAELADEPDVVFGATTWGRNVPHPLAGQVIGPCMDHIPVRVQMHPRQTNIDLMRSVQEQHLASMPFENMGQQSIIESSTYWPRWERLSSVLLYQNLDEGADTFEIEEKNPVHINEIRPPSDRADIAIYVEPHGESTFIQLNFCKHIIEESLAQEILEMLCKRAQALAKSPMGSIQLPRQSRNTAARIPLAQNGPNTGKALQLNKDKNKRARDGSGSEGDTERPVKQARRERRLYVNGNSKTKTKIDNDGSSDLVDHSGHGTNSGRATLSAIEKVYAAWQTVLSMSEAEFDTHYERNTPYFDIWWSHIVAFELSNFYRRQGWADLGMEAIMESATAREQVDLLWQYQST